MFKGGDWTNLDSLHYIWTDALGTPREISHANTQKVVWRWTNIDPFGSNKVQTASGFEYNLRFAGQIYDKETGLHYNHFRDYNPKIGRYIQSDPIGLNGGINTYAYVGANPLRFVDPLGLFRDSVSTYCRAHPVDCVAAGLLPASQLSPPKVPPLPGFCSDLPNILEPNIPPYLPFPLNVLLPIIPHLPGFDGDKPNTGLPGTPADTPTFPPYIESSNGGGGGTSTNPLDAVNRPHNGTGQTQGARSWDKHDTSRPGGTYPPARGNQGAKNQNAEDFVRDTMNNPDLAVINLSRGGVEYRLPNGQGFRVNPDGKFDFVDPFKK